MQGLGYLLRFELAALLAGLLSLAFFPYVTAAVLAGVAVSLIARIARLQRQQGALQREIATLVRSEQHLKDQAYTDTLTGLANRLLLTDRFQQTVERAKRNRSLFALLMVDLDAFKAINDHYGHAAGDFVLQTVAQRLLAAVRASDTVARLGGDEFVLIIDRYEDPEELVRIGRKLVATISDDIKIGRAHV